MYIVAIQFHGKIDLYKPEPGLDNDTGGQIIYVLQACEELARQNHQVTIVTRLLDESNQYSVKAQERNNVKLVRLEMQSNKYRRKEDLWPYVWEFTDSCVNYFIENNKYPDLIIGNYADAGAVALLLNRMLKIPFIFIPHSLGRTKLRNLLRNIDSNGDELEKQYHFSTRIYYEEQLFRYATSVVVSSEHEKFNQCTMYKNFSSNKINVVAPGIEVPSIIVRSSIQTKRKPIILVARLSHTKNLVAPIDVLAQSEWLRANTEIILATTNGKVTDESRSIRVAIEERCAMYPDFVRFYQFDSQEEIFQLFISAREAGGIYFNPSLIEPFGLTTLEAASYGLPVVLTDNGGTTDIIHNVNIGYLVNVYNENDMIQKISSILNDDNTEVWNLFSNNGLHNVLNYYSWYRWVKNIESICTSDQPPVERYVLPKTLSNDAMVIIIEFDGNLATRDPIPLCSFKTFIEQYTVNLCLVYSTDMGLEESLQIVQESALPCPNVFICYSGDEIYSYNSSEKKYMIMKKWKSLIKQNSTHFFDITNQSQFTQCTDKNSSKCITYDDYSDYDSNLKLFPVPADVTKRLVIRWLLSCLSIPLNRCIICCDLNNGMNASCGAIKHVMVNNNDLPTDKLDAFDGVYFCKQKFAAGLIEGIKFFL
ncbi:unnamed protein product [Adineta ricciae]|uniref:sucrose-phosphate synthase n=1 Tax=Adineta ricciae TaxID=249248 RepID=A0A815I3A5_ADIRI|nr:unnamed protein product [Adineta ricciae]CAF1570357.1 unnamed protein product [Adineta ricciae]